MSTPQPGLSRDSLAIGLLLLLAAIAAWTLEAAPAGVSTPNLAQMVPTHFGEWTAIATEVQIVDPSASLTTQITKDQPYTDVLMRTYADPQGRVVLLAVAYAAQQHQEVKIHRPELCYMAHGFKVVAQQARAFVIPDGTGASRAGARLLVRAPDRTEVVSYWIRIGSSYSASAWATRYYLFREALQGHVLDGILVRASQIVPSAQDTSADSYRMQEEFLAELVNSMPSNRRQLLTGGGA